MFSRALVSRPRHCTWVCPLTRTLVSSTALLYFRSGCNNVTCHLPQSCGTVHRCRVSLRPPALAPTCTGVHRVRVCGCSLSTRCTNFPVWCTSAILSQRPPPPSSPPLHEFFPCSKFSGSTQHQFFPYSKFSGSKQHQFFPSTRFFPESTNFSREPAFFPQKQQFFQIRQFFFLIFAFGVNPVATLTAFE